MLMPTENPTKALLTNTPLAMCFGGKIEFAFIQVNLRKYTAWRISGKVFRDKNTIGNAILETHAL